MNNYDYSQDQINIELASNAARVNGTTIAQELCQAPSMHHQLAGHQIWPNPLEDEAKDAAYSNVNLFQFATKNPLSNYCEELARELQFPLNTAYLHGLGVVSSAMNLMFRYDYYGEEKPTNLYVVTAQPPSTGKSGVNGRLSTPVRDAYEVVAAANRLYRAESAIKIGKLEIEVKKAENDMVLRDALKNLQVEQDFHDSKPNYRYAVDDATPEGLEDMAGIQNGLFNVISDEADAINILMGGVYGSGTANHGVFLKGWDGDHMSVVRIGRDGANGLVRGTIAVIAQDESISAILEAGRSGRGVSERILMLREQSLLGTRTHGTRKQSNGKAAKDYKLLADNIVSEQEKVVLKVPKEAIAVIDNYRNLVEPHMADGEKYGGNLVRGVVGKADKQILKIASVLHACDNWAGKTPKRRLSIHEDTVQQAVAIFDNLVNTFIEAADAKGFVGSNSEMTELIDWLTARNNNKNTRGQKLDVRKLVDGIRKKDVFSGMANITQKTRKDYLPELIKRGIVAFDGKAIFINPKL